MMATQNQNPPAPQTGNPASMTDKLAKWGIRGILIFFLLLLFLLRGCQGCGKEKNPETEGPVETQIILVPKGEFLCHPSQELSLPPIDFTGEVKIRVNGHNHFIYYPSIKDWVYRDKDVEQYTSPNVGYDDVIKVKADTATEKEPFVVYLYQVTEVEVKKQ